MSVMTAVVIEKYICGLQICIASRLKLASQKRQKNCFVAKAIFDKHLICSNFYQNLDGRRNVFASLFQYVYIIFNI